MEKIETNSAHLIGKIQGGLTFNHEKCGERFYTTKLEVKRLSDKTDIIPMMISDRLINVLEDYDGQTVDVTGQFRSYNRLDGLRNKLMLSMFAREIRLIEEFTDYTKVNHVFLDGYICSPPVYRKTPLGRQITDILLAVNRAYNKSDYIPCVTWGRNALYASGLEIGTHLQIEGRIQSREYQKRISETETEKRVAIEISAGKLELVQ